MKKNKENNNKKFILDKYRQDVFPPYTLYVIMYHDSKDITDLFVWDDGAEIEPVDINTYQGATYGHVYKKDDKDKKPAVLVGLNMNSLDNEIDAINTIAHEGSHVVFRILDYCNINLCECTNETFAFMQGWATRSIWNSYKNNKK